MWIPRHVPKHDSLECDKLDQKGWALDRYQAQTQNTDFYIIHTMG